MVKADAINYILIEHKTCEMWNNLTEIQIIERVAEFKKSVLVLFENNQSNQNYSDIMFVLEMLKLLNEYSSKYVL